MTHPEIPTPRNHNPTIQAAIATINANARDTREAEIVMEWLAITPPQRTPDAMNQPHDRDAS